VSKEATPQSQCEATAVASMRRGDTALCLPNVVTAAELDMLVAWSAAAADSIRLADGKASSDRVRMHVAPMSADPTPTSACCDAILGRVLGVIDQQLPSVVETLFNTASATNSTLASLSELHADGDLQYSAREPAINVYYAPSGEFLPHQDHHSLTVLIPLSSAAGRRGRWLFQSSFIAGAARAFFGPWLHADGPPSLHAGGSFVGGGTGFWPKGSHEREAVDSLFGNSLFGNSLWEEPAVVLAPNAGTALL
jgi:hypothetical protein